MYDKFLEKCYTNRIISSSQQLKCVMYSWSINSSNDPQIWQFSPRTSTTGAQISHFSLSAAEVTDVVLHTSTRLRSSTSFASCSISLVMYLGCKSRVRVGYHFLASGIKSRIFPKGFRVFGTKVSKTQVGFGFRYHFSGLGRVSKKSGFSLGFPGFWYKSI